MQGHICGEAGSVAEIWVQGMTRRYIVIASPTKRGLIYLIYDTLNQVSIESGYGCEKWAQRQADILEDRWNDRHCEGGDEEKI